MSANARTLAILAVLTASGPAVADQPPRLPVLVPITGFLSLEGTSQRNGAELALRDSGVAFDVDDTATSPRPRSTLSSVPWPDATVTT